MKIMILEDVAGYKKGEVVDLPRQTAMLFVAGGEARQAKIKEIRG